MGWRFTSDGMRLVLSQEVTPLIRERFRAVVEEFLHSGGCSLADMSHFVLHPGGRRILEAYCEALGCTAEDLAWAGESLASVGNLSSASVLFVLAELLRAGVCKQGHKGLLAAPGPGFGVEMLVLEW